MEYPPALIELISALKQLPSVGARSAERLALYLLQNPKGVGPRLTKAIDFALSAIQPCAECGFYAESGHCPICANPTRDKKMLCVVEQQGDVLRLEKVSGFKGLYHVLGGRLSPLDGIGPEQLRIAQLETRIEKSKPDEVILALGVDMEGETTALYLAPLLKKHAVKVSRLATGLPAGSGLEYADSVTLGYALKGRTEL